MKPLRASLLAGAAARMIAATAQAQSPNTHVLTIRLPGGGVERIQYTGDTPPQVFVDANPARADPLWFFPGLGPDSPFAALDRMSQELDRRAARMLEQAEAMIRNLPSNPDQLIQAYSGSLPAVQGPAGGVGLSSKSKHRPETITANAKTGGAARAKDTALVRQAALHY